MLKNSRLLARWTVSRGVGLFGGFTVVEVITMLGIIAVLISVMAPVLNNRIRAAQVSSLKSGLENIQTAITAYHSDVTVYPANLWELQTSPNGGNESCYGDGGAHGIGTLYLQWRGPYITQDLVTTTNPPTEVGLNGGDWIMADQLIRSPVSSTAALPVGRLMIQVNNVPRTDATSLNELVDGVVVPPLSAGQDTAGTVRWGAASGGAVTVTYGFAVKGC